MTGAGEGGIIDAMAKDSVVVFGSSQARRDSPHFGLASELGAAIARRGADVRCGGYGGVMEAVASGAKSAGGRVIGCTLKWFAESRVSNSHLDEVHEAASLHARIECLLRGARGAVVLPGGVGTLNELFWVWTLLLFDRDEGPQSIVLLGEPWEELMAVLERRFEFPQPIRALVGHARTADEAAAMAIGAPGGAR
jgi:uncharacterized protein (TIGR00730 family)